MAFHDNMAPSPERPSSKRNDDGEKRSPKTKKRLKKDEEHSSKPYKNRDEALLQKNQGSEKEDYRESRGHRKRVRSRSPIEAPSSSKCSLRSKSGSRERKKDNSSHHSSSERSYNDEDFRENRRQNQDESGSRGVDEFFGSRSAAAIINKEFLRHHRNLNRPTSPTINYKFNASKPLPPGAKGKFDLRL